MVVSLEQIANVTDPTALLVRLISSFVPSFAVSYLNAQVK